jgi:hypothetical protein
MICLGKEALLSTWPPRRKEWPIKGGSNVDLGREKQDRQLDGTRVEIPSSLEK